MGKKIILNWLQVFSDLSLEKVNVCFVGNIILVFEYVDVEPKYFCESV